MGDTAAAPAFRWYYGVIPSMGWDAAFLGPDDLLTAPEKYERIPVRALGKLDLVKDKASNKPVLELHRNFAGHFGCVDIDSPGLVDRKLFAWIFAATPAAAEDWTKTWTEPVVSLDLVDGSEAEAAALAEMARQKGELAKSLKRGPRELVK